MEGGVAHQPLLVSE